VLWQVFNEPLTQTYTPKSGDVFAAVDREANRIDWQSMWRRGTVKAIRKTNDDRYVVTYLAGNQKNIPTLHIAGHIHLAVGYPAVRILPDLQAYRNKTKDYKSVVNAYENHEHIYDSLSKHGGVVVVRGRGIVASRIIQRLYELRLAGSDVKILHLMRSPKSDGNRYEKAKRQVSRHWEFQPFNWPKACWGGDLRVILERANARERSLLLDDWGGTTTADRHDWRQIIDQGQAEGWYEIVIGGVDCWERNRDGQLETVIYSKVVKTEARLQTDFIIDATGLEAKIDHHRVCPRN
jgi:pSer/pThr/pTyr-binding forkhead associated (FHA) protein